MADTADTTMAAASFGSLTLSEVYDTQPTYRYETGTSAMPVIANRPNTSTSVGGIGNYVLMPDLSLSLSPDPIPAAQDVEPGDEELIQMLCASRYQLNAIATQTQSATASSISASGSQRGLLAQPDARALEILYDRHSRRCYSLAVRIMNNPAEAEEVVQEVFLKLWQRPQSFDQQRGRFITWLLSVVHHRCIDELRHNQRMLPRNIRFDAEDGEDLLDRQPSRQKGPEEVTWESFQRTAIRNAMSRLSTTQRRVIELGYFGGMTQQEMAAVLCEPLGTIKTRVRLAMQKLRLMLEADGWENRF